MKAGRPRLPTRTQVTIRIEIETKKKLITEWKRTRKGGRIEIGRVIDQLVMEHL